MDSFPCVSEARVPGSIPGGSTLSRISPEWEADCKPAVAGSTPERGSIFGGGAHAMEFATGPLTGTGRLRRGRGETSAPPDRHPAGAVEVSETRSPHATPPRGPSLTSSPSTPRALTRATYMRHAGVPKLQVGLCTCGSARGPRARGNRALPGTRPARTAAGRTHCVVITDHAPQLARILVDQRLAKAVAPSCPEPVRARAELVSAIPLVLKRFEHLVIRSLSHPDPPWLATLCAARQMQQSPSSGITTCAARRTASGRGQAGGRVPVLPSSGSSGERRSAVGRPPGYSFLTFSATEMAISTCWRRLAA
jgi:hypothetical protein